MISMPPFFDSVAEAVIVAVRKVVVMWKGGEESSNPKMEEWEYSIGNTRY